MTTLHGALAPSWSLRVAQVRGFWAPSSDDRWGLAVDDRLVYVADASGPTYGGHYAPVAVDAGLAAFVTAFGNGQGGALGSLRRSLAATNDTMRCIARDENVDRPMSLAHATTSLTALYLATGDRLAVLQVGSSRAYLVRDGKLHVPVPEHTLATTLAAEGRSVDEFPASWRVVTRLLGFSDHVTADQAMVALEPGDMFVLCSDGAWACASFEKRLLAWLASFP